MNDITVIKNGNLTEVIKGGIQTFDEIPLGVYKLVLIPFRGVMLSSVSGLEVPETLYGEIESMSSRMQKTCMDRDVSTGIHLTGKKGGGKSLQLRHFAKLLLEENGVPTILFDDADLLDHGVIDFIQRIPNQCCIVMDEFEKVFAGGSQEKMLSMLDGLSSNRHIFILTSNDIFSVSSYMLQRPGRVYYTIPYDGVSNEIVDQYVDENLKGDKERKASIKDSFHKCKELSFDMMKAHVEELNRFGEDYASVERLIPSSRFKQYKKCHLLVKVHKGEKSICSFAGTSTIESTASVNEIYIDLMRVRWTPEKGGNLRDFYNYSHDDEEWDEFDDEEGKVDVEDQEVAQRNSRQKGMMEEFFKTLSDCDSDFLRQHQDNFHHVEMDLSQSPIGLKEKGQNKYESVNKIGPYTIRVNVKCSERNNAY